DIAEPEIFYAGNPFVAQDGFRVLDAAADQIEPEKTAGRRGHVGIFSRDILDERAAAVAALDVDGVAGRVREPAILNPDVPNAARRFAADADARKDAVGHRAIADQH